MRWISFGSIEAVFQENIRRRVKSLGSLVNTIFMLSENSPVEAREGPHRYQAEIAFLTECNPAGPLDQHDGDVPRRYVCQIHKGGVPEATLANGEHHEKVAYDAHHCQDRQDVEGQYPHIPGRGFFAEAGNRGQIRILTKWKTENEDI